jgi:hypothetical protein
MAIIMERIMRAAGRIVDPGRASASGSDGDQRWSNFATPSRNREWQSAIASEDATAPRPPYRTVADPAIGPRSIQCRCERPALSRIGPGEGRGRDVGSRHDGHLSAGGAAVVGLVGLRDDRPVVGAGQHVSAPSGAVSGMVTFAVPELDAPTASVGTLRPPLSSVSPAFLT